MIYVKFRFTEQLCKKTRAMYFTLAIIHTVQPYTVQ